MHRAPRAIGIARADRASLRLDDATHLRELTGEFLAWAFRPGPLQKLRIQHVPVDPLADMRAGLLPRSNQALRLEDGQRFPNRGPADAKLRGQLDLARQRPTLVPYAGDDQLGDFARDVGVGLAEFDVPGQIVTLKP